MFSPEWWAGVLNNLFGGLNVLLNNSVSDNLVRTLKFVTNTNTLSLNTKEFMPFFGFTLAIALVLGFCMSLLSLLKSVIKKESDPILTAFKDFFGTFVIGFFGLTGYSILVYLIDLISQGITAGASHFVDKQGVWYDTIVNIMTVTNPGAAGVGDLIANVGGYMLYLQTEFLRTAIIPVLLLFMLAYVFRDGKFTQFFIRLAVAFLAIIVASKLFVTCVLAVAAVILNWSFVTGPEQIFVLGFILLIAGNCSWIMFVAFFIASRKTRQDVKAVLKKGDEGKNEANKPVDTPNTAPQRPTAEPQYDSVPSPSVYEKGRQVYDSAKGKVEQVQGALEKTHEVANKVVLVSDGVAAVAPVVAKVGAAIPYVAPIATGVGVAAVAVSAGARKVANGSHAARHPIEHAKAYNDSRPRPSSEAPETT